MNTSRFAKALLLYLSTPASTSTVINRIRANPLVHRPRCRCCCFGPPVQSPPAAGGGGAAPFFRSSSDNRQRRRTTTTITMATATAASTTTSGDDSPSEKNNNSDHRVDFDAYLRDRHNQIILLDGGTGEELFRQGVPDDRKLWSATALVHAQFHDILRQVHRSFLQAGASTITTNSYGVAPGVGFDDEPRRFELVSLSGKIARQAVEDAVVAAKSDAQKQQNNKQHPSLFVVGSLGPLIESYRADKVLLFEQGYEYYKTTARALLPHVDAFLAETMSSVEESVQAVAAVAATAATTKDSEDDDTKNSSRKSNKPPSIMVSYTLDEHGRLRSGEKVCSAVPRLLDFAKERNVRGNVFSWLAAWHVYSAISWKSRADSIPLLCLFFFLLVPAVLFNCATPEAITIALKQMRDDSNLSSLLNENRIRLGAYANRLTPVASDWSLEGSDGPQPMRRDLDPQRYWEFVQDWIANYNVTMIGGCCGITPEHIAYLKSKLD